MKTSLFKGRVNNISMVITSVPLPKNQAEQVKHPGQFSTRINYKN